MTKSIGHEIWNWELNEFSIKILHNILSILSLHSDSNNNNYSFAEFWKQKIHILSIHAVLFAFSATQINSIFLRQAWHFHLTKLERRKPHNFNLWYQRTLPKSYFERETSVFPRWNRSYNWAKYKWLFLEKNRDEMQKS